MEKGINYQHTTYCLGNHSAIRMVWPFFILGENKTKECVAKYRLCKTFFFIFVTFYVLTFIFKF